MSESSFNKLPARYEIIENANKKSWYLDGSQPHPFEQFTSIGTIKPSAALFGERAVRRTLAGNMSTLEKYDKGFNDARPNMLRFYESLGLTQDDLEASALILPQREYDIPLKMLDADHTPMQPQVDGEPLTPTERADMLYTYNPEQILAVRPADCPVIFAGAETPHGEVLTLTHLASGGATAGFVEQMFERFDELGIDRDSLRMYVTPGAQAENYVYFNENNPNTVNPGVIGMYKDVRPGTQTQRDGTEKVGFYYGLDTPRYVYSELIRLGMQTEHIYMNTSDTARPDSGYSSHTRAFNSNGAERNIRDLMIARMLPTQP